MEIKYYATLRDITKRKEEIWSSPAGILEELINSLCQKYGKSFAKWVSTEDGGYGSLSIFLVNGIDCRSLDGFHTKLTESDTISIFPPVAGG
jgi:molybdopterin synthase sulfur carrier subunit